MEWIQNHNLIDLKLGFLRDWLKFALDVDQFRKYNFYFFENLFFN